jgi:hypothetical protein
MEITAGLFALGGVALTALLGELRAWREGGIKQTAELKTLRRETVPSLSTELCAMSRQWPVLAATAMRCSPRSVATPASSDCRASAGCRTAWCWYDVGLVVSGQSLHLNFATVAELDMSG